MWNAFVDRVDADSETLNGWSNCHRELLNNNLPWQYQAEELAGRVTNWIPKGSSE